MSDLPDLAFAFRGHRPDRCKITPKHPGFDENLPERLIG